MKIAVIGSGISGLTAGSILARAGHEVAVFEQSETIGGRLATHSLAENESLRLDHGIPCFHAKTDEFKKLISKFSDEDIITEWKGTFLHKNKNGEPEVNKRKSPCYMAPKGMESISHRLARHCDVRLNEKVGGLTHIGEHRRKKKSWMLNFPTAHTEGADAVIISAPARQAYALLNTTTDEIETLKLIREIDEVEYESEFSLLVHDEKAAIPDWNTLSCDDKIIASISNETAKRAYAKEGAFFVIRTASAFAKKHIYDEHTKIKTLIFNQLKELLADKFPSAKPLALHFWRYSRAKNPLPHSYMQIKGNDTPLALVGSYMKGNTIESAYLSGLKLANRWAEEYPA